MTLKTSKKTWNVAPSEAASFGVMSPEQRTPKKMKRCYTCEQVFSKQSRSCPHCLCEYHKYTISEFGQDNEGQEAFERVRVNLDRIKDNRPESRPEFIQLLFSRGMELRFKDPRRSRELFYQIIAQEPDNYEARMKASWLEIRLGKYDALLPLLEIVVVSNTSTLDQKQRAYNNLCCSCLFTNPPDFSSAERYALLGIRLDGVGSRKLWENYGAVLRNQTKYEEARDAYAKAITFYPASNHALKCVKSLNKLLKQQQQQQLQKIDINNEFYELDKENNFNSNVLSSNNNITSNKNSNNNNNNNINTGCYAITRRSNSFVRILTNKQRYEKQ